MKKFNKNIILFVFSIAFVLYGFAGYVFDIHKGIGKLYEAKESFAETKDITGTLEKMTGDDLWYHDALIDINSVRINLLNNRIAVKSDGAVVKTNSGKLSFYSQDIRDEKELKNAVDKVKEIYGYATANGSGFLYVAVPLKQQYEEFPPNIEDHSAENYAALLDCLKQNDIPYLDCDQALRSSPIKQDDRYFITDHHWKPYSGFVVAGSICDKLAALYSFSYDKEKTDIGNYDIEVYKDYFLGSQGKKVGQYFTWEGCDDFELIVPRFDTDLTESIPYSETVREGSFDDTLLHKEYLSDNLHHAEVYETYSGGNIRLQIFRNNLLENGKKIMIVRTSYAGVVTPYLALQAKELHIIDNRNEDYLSGDFVDVKQYIKEIDPDYVIVLE